MSHFSNILDFGVLSVWSAFLSLRFSFLFEIISHQSKRFEIWLYFYTVQYIINQCVQCLLEAVVVALLPYQNFQPNLVISSSAIVELSRWLVKTMPSLCAKDFELYFNALFNWTLLLSKLEFSSYFIGTILTNALSLLKKYVSNRVRKTASKVKSQIIS